MKEPKITILREMSWESPMCKCAAVFHFDTIGDAPITFCSTADYFAGVYRAQLAALDRRTVIRELGSNAILLCWEAAGQFCHRRLVAEWLESYYGRHVVELAKEPDRSPQTLCLFY